MKLSIYKLCFVALMLPLFTQAQIRKEKKINRTIPMNEDGHVTIAHFRGPLTIKKSTDGQFRFESTITVIGKYDEDVDIALENSDVEIIEMTNSVEIKVLRNVVKWQSINNKSTIIFTNGDRVQGIREIDVTSIAYIPEVEYINLSNRYEDISFDNLQADQVHIDLHDATLKGQHIDGDFYFKTKYSDGEMGNVTGKMELDVHDSDINFGTSSSIVGKFKYSDCHIGDTGPINLDIHDSEIVLGAVNGKSIIKDKYSVITMGDCRELNLDIHDAKFKMGNGDVLDLVSKYCEVEIGNVGTIELDSHDDDFDFGKVDHISLVSKYTKFEFDEIRSSLNIESHDDDFIVNDFGSSFTGGKIDGKYTNFQINRNSSADFTLEATMKYGSLKYDEDKVKTTYYKEKNSYLDAALSFGNPKGNKLSVECHDCTIKVN